ncbi:hypothetical protein CEP51_000481 [Fusarium floridanum]|uniref:Heterokaryon incompatibility domain-containing protein n=1 Tax=Fusarium floridanum TaxID=1325733 RepID=A0A428SME8_9HYPO|nr:hypothetical protein CEP51_000481 [Fusarium floridanum]
MNFIHGIDRRLASRAPRLREDYLAMAQAFDDRALRAINRLLQRPWWSRAWIIQEATCDNETFVRCGRDVTDFTAFVATINCLVYHVVRLSLRGHGIPDIRHLQKVIALDQLREQRGQSKYRPYLLDMLDNFPEGVTSDNEFRTASQASESWVNRSALLAKLFSAGLLDADGTRWISGDFESAFETRTSGDLSSNIGRKAQLVAQANYILIAGDTYIKEVRHPSKKYRVEVTPARWKLWASKLQEVADAASMDTEWDLKSRAQKAHDKMVELYPEAFKREGLKADES